MARNEETSSKTSSHQSSCTYYVEKTPARKFMAESLVCHGWFASHAARISAQMAAERDKTRDRSSVNLSWNFVIKWKIWDSGRIFRKSRSSKVQYDMQFICRSDVNQLWIYRRVCVKMCSGSWQLGSSTAADKWSRAHHALVPVEKSACLKACSKQPPAKTNSHCSSDACNVSLPIDAQHKKEGGLRSAWWC